MQRLFQLGFQNLRCKPILDINLVHSELFERETFLCAWNDLMALDLPVKSVRICYDFTTEDIVTLNEMHKIVS